MHESCAGSTWQDGSLSVATIAFARASRQAFNPDGRRFINDRTVTIVRQRSGGGVQATESHKG
jgi:hypothetical protein